MKITDEDKKLSKKEGISIRQAQQIRLEREQQGEREGNRGDTHQNTSSGQPRPSS